MSAFLVVCVFLTFVVPKTGGLREAYAADVTVGLFEQDPTQLSSPSTGQQTLCQLNQGRPYHSLNSLNATPSQTLSNHTGCVYCVPLIYTILPCILTF